MKKKNERRQKDVPYCLLNKPNEGKNTEIQTIKHRIIII
jgi:hypothetical protein